jgi:hypothetical protein
MGFACALLIAGNKKTPQEEGLNSLPSLCKRGTIGSAEPYTPEAGKGNHFSHA